MRGVIVDSIVHWLKEFHVDGFRFDLAAMIDDDTLQAAREAAQAPEPLHGGGPPLPPQSALARRRPARSEFPQCCPHFVLGVSLAAGRAASARWYPAPCPPTLVRGPAPWAAHPTHCARTWSFTDQQTAPWPPTPKQRPARGVHDLVLPGRRGLPSLRAGHPSPLQARPGRAPQARPSLRAGGPSCSPLTERWSPLCPSLRTGRRTLPQVWWHVLAITTSGPPPEPTGQGPQLGSRIQGPPNTLCARAAASDGGSAISPCQGAGGCRACGQGTRLPCRPARGERHRLVRACGQGVCRARP